MLALEVSSAAGRPPYGGIGSAIRNLVGALLRLDPETHYVLGHRLSRWRRHRRSELFDAGAPNAELRVLVDPFNGWILRDARLLHSMGIWLPRTPRRLPKLVTVHDLNPIRNPQWVTPHWREQRSRKIGSVVSRAAHVVTYSEFIAREIRDEWGLDADRVHAIPLGVDSRVFRPLDARESEGVRERYGDYVLAVGVQTPRKNFDGLVHAVARIPGLRLVHVGRPSNGAAAFRDAVEQAKLGERLLHFDSLPHEELVQLFCGARAYVVPSLYEGFGLTVLEAMACGAPVVCSDAASLPEVAGDAALHVDARDVEALSGAIARVLHDSELAARLRRRGLERAHVCTWESTAQRLRALYRDVARA